MRVLGVDVGERRIGLALSDASAVLATPLRVLTVSRPAEQGAIAVLREIAMLTNQEDGLAGIVVGLPRSLDGASHRQTRHVLSFVETLRQDTTSMHDTAGPSSGRATLEPRGREPSRAVREKLATAKGTAGCGGRSGYPPGLLGSSAATAHQESRVQGWRCYVKR